MCLSPFCSTDIDVLARLTGVVIWRWGSQDTTDFRLGLRSLTVLREPRDNSPQLGVASRLIMEAFLLRSAGIPAATLCLKR